MAGVRKRSPASEKTMNKMETKKVPVLLITGYLGSGKTTLLNRILTNSEGIRFAVIVNDIGEVNIDETLIQKGGVVGQDGGDDLVALQNGCICCTLQADLMRQLDDLIEKDCFDYIAIEASGVCNPAPIANTICAMEQAQPVRPPKGRPHLDCIVTVADALRLAAEFGCGKDLRRKDLDEEDVENLIVDQIEFCNIVLLNKIDEVTEEQAAEIRSVIKALQPNVPVLECNYSDVPLRNLLNTNSFDFERTATSAAWVREIENPDSNVERHVHVHHHHDHEHDHDHECGSHCHHHHNHDHGETEEYGIGTWVYFRRRPFDLNKFDYFIDKKWPRNIIRSKGLVYFDVNTDMSYIFEQASVQKKLTEAGYWYASAPAEELELMLARDPQLRRDWDPEYGDRMVKLIFIGKDLDKAALEKDLDACLVDE